jgi:hypothetical protein
MSEQLVFAFVPLCFGGFFFLAGTILLFFTIRARKKSTASLAWPSTAGTIVSSTVRRNSSTDEDGHTNFSFSPIVEYDYSVNGQAYKGKKIHYGITPSQDNATAQKEADRFPAGRQVTVFFNPEKPNEAVLEQKEVKSKVGLILGIVFMGLTLCSCLVSGIMLLRGLAEM